MTGGQRLPPWLCDLPKHVQEQQPVPTAHRRLARACEQCHRCGKRLIGRQDAVVVKPWSPYVWCPECW